MFLFLDVDYVLNSDRWDAAQYERLGPAYLSIVGGLEEWASRHLDPAAVARLDRVVRETGCAVILSSKWREHFALPAVTGLLRGAGFSGALAGATPVFSYPMADWERTGEPWRSSERNPHPLYRDHLRGLEVEMWLFRHFPRPEERRDLRVAIVDDRGDFGRLTPRLVRTSEAEGLGDVEATALVRLLGAPLGGLLDDPHPWLRPEALRPEAATP